jgi:hypothetical protein
MDMLEIRVPEGTNPQQGMDRLSTAYEELVQNAVPLPEFLRAAFIVRALPPSYGSLSTWLAEKKKDELRVDDVAHYVRGISSTRATFKNTRAPETAHKITAVRSRLSDPVFDAQVERSQPHKPGPQQRPGHSNAGNQPRLDNRPFNPPRGPAPQQKRAHTRKRGKGGKGKERAHAADDNDCDSAALTINTNEPKIASRKILDADRAKARAFAVSTGLAENDPRVGQIARAVADGRRADWLRACDEQDALLARRAAHDPYVEPELTAGIPATLNASLREAFIEEVEGRHAEWDTQVDAAAKVCLLCHAVSAVEAHVKEDAAMIEDDSIIAPAPIRASAPLPVVNRTPSPIHITAEKVWHPAQLRYGAWDSEDRVFKCIQCFWEVSRGFCQNPSGCNTQYEIAPEDMLDGEDIEDGYWDGTVWVVGEKPRKRKAPPAKPAAPEPKPLKRARRNGPPGIRASAVAEADSRGTRALRTIGAPEAGPSRKSQTRARSLERMNQYDSLPIIAHVAHLCLALRCKYEILGCTDRIPDDDVYNVVHDTCFTADTCDETKPMAWMLDSGASKHFTNSIDDFVDYTPWPKSEQRLLTTATSTTKIVGEGTVIVKARDLNGKFCHVRINGVRYVPELNTRLLSLGTFLSEGMNVRGDNKRLVLENDGKTFMVFEPRGPRDTIYGVNLEPLSGEVAKALKTIHNVDYDIMHKRFAHPSDDVLRHARSKTMEFPDVVFHPDGICRGCAMGKMPNRHFTTNDKRANKPFELIHSDLKSYPIKSFHSYKYVVTFFDDHSSHAWIKLLKTKDQTIHASKHFIEMVKTKYNAKISRWKCNQGGEYMLHAYKKMLLDAGIELTPLPPYYPQINGRAERFMRTFSEKEAAMRHDADLPDSWWEFTVEHGVYVYNRTPLKLQKWLTPFEIIEGAKPDITHLRTLGCEAYVFRPEDTRKNKLAPRSETCTYVGWGTSGHRFITKTGKFIQSAHAYFDELKFPRAKNKPMTQKSQPTTKDAPNRAIGGAPSPSSNGIEIEWSHDDDSSISLPISTGIDLPVTQLRADSAGLFAPMSASRSNSPGFTPVTVPYAILWNPAQLDLSDPDEEQDVVDSPIAMRLRRSNRDRNAPVRPDNVYGHMRPTEIDALDRRSQLPLPVAPGRSQATRPAPAVEVVPKPPPAPSAAARSPIVERLRSATGAKALPPPPGISINDVLVRLQLDQAPKPVREAPDTSASSGQAPDIAKLAREGEELFLRHMLALAAKESKPEREWSHCDVLALPKAERDLWLGPKGAYEEELEALAKRGVFGPLVDLPKGKKVIGTRWVLARKSDGRRKERLVAQDFTQREGIDFDEVFPSVVRFETVRIMLATAALENWYITAVDVHNAYLYGKLDEELYARQPEGFKARGQEHKVRRLNRALYGLKQVGLVWWRELAASMIEELGFTMINSDAGLWVFRRDGKFCIALIYVDDGIFAGPDINFVNEVKTKFMKHWECRDLGNAKEYLGMRIERKDGKIYIDQCAYLDKLLERCAMGGAAATATPLPAGYIPTPSESEADPESRRRFQVIIGSLMYLMIGTRPDISYAVTKLSQYSANPSREHLNAALHICRYLVGTRNYKLVYDGASKRGLIAYADSDWNTDPHNRRRPQTGFFLQLAGGAVTWTLRTQKTVALSSTEAEYYALSDTSRQLAWVRNIFFEIGMPFKGPIPLCGDNQGSIFTAQNPVLDKRLKHIDIKYYHIWQEIRLNKVAIYFVEGSENPADLFTKNLPRVKFAKFRPLLGLEFC